MLEYLFPENLIAFGIIWVLIGFFSIWFIGLVIYWRWLRTERKRIENNQNIQPLVNAQQKRDRGREDNDQKVDPENTFSEFCEESSLNRRSPITKHLKAIFVAGWDETRLESSELINHTTSELFKWNNLFRSMLAVFIVIGLLGTLFGLADSLTGLSPALKASMVNEAPIEENEESRANRSTTENSDRMTQALGGLLDKMKGALAPSIWGIIFTIIGVILYGIYLQLACHPVKSILEQSTLSIWIPQLYPTTSQKLIQTLQQSEAQMEKGLETAAQFSDSVKKVDNNIDEFIESLTQASDLTEPLSNSVTQINKAASDISAAADVLNTSFTESLDKFSNDFTSSVNNLTGFQEEIRKLHQQFQDTANENLERQTNNWEEQNQKFDATLDVLKNYESLYVDACRQIDDTLQTFLNQINEANTSIETTNRKFLEEINATNRGWIEEIQTQLKTDLAIIQPTLKEVQGTLDKRLTELKNQLQFFQAPIERAANQIEGTIASFTRIMEGVVGDIKSEYKKQSESIEKQNKNYAAQLTESQNLSESVISLLKQLDVSSSNQKSAVDELSANVGRLTKDIENLDNTIKTFTSGSEELSQSVSTIKEDIEKLGNASQQFVEKVEKADVTPLTASIEKLNISVNQISQHSRTFANAVNTLEKRESSSRVEQKSKRSQRNLSGSVQEPKRSIFGRIRNRFSRRKTAGQSTSVQEPKRSIFGRIRNRFSRRKTVGQSTSESQANNEEE